MQIQVSGGTVRHKRAPKPKPGLWRCDCPNPEGRSSRWKSNPGYLRRCPDCTKERPDG